MVKSILTLIASLAMLTLSHAQEPERSVLKGKIMDEDGIAVGYAYVFVEGSDYGTFSNKDGEFYLSFETYESGKTVTFEAEGYEILSQSLSAKEDLIVNLKKSYIVPSDQIHDHHPEVVVENILLNVKDNYATNQLLHKVFFREYEFDKHNEPFYITELMVHYLRENYHTKERDKFKIEKGRILLDKDIAPIDVRHIGGGLFDINSDIIKYPMEFLEPVTMRKYKYEFDEIIVHEGDISTFKIKFSPYKGKGKYHGYLYVRNKSFALLKAEIYHDHSALKDLNERSKADGFLWKSIAKTINYKRNSKGVYYLSDIIIEAKGHNHDIGQDITSYTELFTVDCESAYFFANEYYYLDEVNALDEIELDTTPDFWQDINHIPIEKSLLDQ